MKLFTQGILARRKIVFIFLIAILLPSLVVGYLSFTTFSKRREAVKNILESNLWISGEAALKSIEDALFDDERKTLDPENFTVLHKTDEKGINIQNKSSQSQGMAGKLFLLDADYHIVIPKTGRGDSTIIASDLVQENSEFARAFKRAESQEFSRRNFTQAAETYRRCISLAPSDKHKALILESLGRCYLASRDYTKAYKIYDELASDHGQYKNKAGHPYGILAALQLHDIEKRRRHNEASLKILLSLYEKIQAGAWLIDLPSYDFFTTEIESILEAKGSIEKYPNLQESYDALRGQQSPYLRRLIFSEFLRNEVIPKIKDRQALYRFGSEASRSRFVATQNEDFCLVSYTSLPDFQSDKAFVGGYCWDLNALKNETLPRVIDDIKKETGLNIQLIDEDGQKIPSETEDSTSSDPLILSFRQFPFPWKLLVSQPALKDLERTARRENWLYGILLAFVVVLMLLGGFLIVRDISREAETTRLKTEFVHNISHELKTPLTLIRLYGETLQRKENLSDKERKESYEIITKESERLSHLINNVLDFSRIEMGRKEFDLKKGNLAQVIRDTAESYRYHLEKKGFIIHKEIASDLPDMSFDAEAMASVLVNLLSNAMKFSPDKKEVTIRLFREDKDAVLQVADKGIGISPKEISSIFQRFYRSKSEQVSDTRGSGLGLTLVQHITEAHGGRIKVSSEPGKGSVFSIILPISDPSKEKEDG